MECNKEDAIKAMDIAKRKIAENDYNGAKKLANKAQNLYPKLDGLKQVMMLIDVYISLGWKQNHCKESKQTMESNEEEAKIAMDTAEKKLSENDYNGAKTFVDKAKKLYPNLDGLKQVLRMIDVYIFASNKINGEADWYGVLNVDPLSDDEAVKKQYKKLALLLHPDKNRFNGAEGAFKLDPSEPHEYESGSRYRSEPEPEQPDPDSSWKQENPWEPEEVIFFWTCFVATEIIPEMVDGRPVYRFSAKFQRTSESTSDDASSSNTSDSDSANQAEENILPATSARGDEKEA
ncbi:PREDICTED: dnaJ homolog subfamily B member 14-like [Camelina sativa]|uniref:DnaJ homolog subfamily B member 14-like n=1 Tax=Camelina sativa TaxID=90675 RepID=A0ABM0V615_CAMSA|nr:PREDICTED: dnaJ homolog subfamily B member 14-like [Camelina sativa]